MERINIANTNKLQKAIEDAQGRATARTITVDTILRILGNIDKLGIPRKRLNGTTVDYDGAEKFPSSYKWVPESTHFSAEFKNGKWFVTHIWRGGCPNLKTSRGFIAFSDEAKKWLLEDLSKIK